MKKYILIFFITATIFIFAGCNSSKTIAGDKLFTMDKADSLDTFSALGEETITNEEVNNLYNEFKNLRLTEAEMTEMHKYLEGGVIITFRSGEKTESVRPYGDQIIMEDKIYDTDKNISEIVTKFIDKYRNQVFQNDEIDACTIKIGSEEYQLSDEDAKEFYKTLKEANFTETDPIDYSITDDITVTFKNEEKVESIKACGYKIIVGDKTFRNTKVYVTGMAKNIADKYINPNEILYG